MKTIQEIKETHKRLSKELGGVIAVIVKNGRSLGVQYWTPEMIDKGESLNTDNTKSVFIERL